MIEQVVNSGESIQLITKRLYPETAKHFGVKPHSVEHALRTLIGTCWAHGDRDALNEIAGRVLTHAPSNAEFIYMIAAYIKNGGRHENPVERLAHRRLFAFDK